MGVEETWHEYVIANGDRVEEITRFFVSAAELVEAWRIFTPLLHQIDEQRPQPVVHPFGALPHGYVEWAKQRGIEVEETWHEYVIANDKNNSGTLNYEEVMQLARRFFDGR